MEIKFFNDQLKLIVDIESGDATIESDGFTVRSTVADAIVGFENAYAVLRASAALNGDLDD